MFLQQLHATVFTCDQLWSVGNKYPRFQNLSVFTVKGSCIVPCIHTYSCHWKPVVFVLDQATAEQWVELGVQCPSIYSRGQRQQNYLPAGELKHEVWNYSQGNQQCLEFKWKQPPLWLYKHLSTNLKDLTFRLMPASLMSHTLTCTFQNFEILILLSPIPNAWCNLLWNFDTRMGVPD